MLEITVVEVIFQACRRGGASAAREIQREHHAVELQTPEVFETLHCIASQLAMTSRLFEKAPPKTENASAPWYGGAS